MAVRTGKFEIMVKLLESKANVDVRDGDNNTPLQLAVANGHVDMVQALMAEHPDLSVVNEEGKCFVALVWFLLPSSFVYLFSFGGEFNKEREDSS